MRLALVCVLFVAACGEDAPIPRSGKDAYLERRLRVLLPDVEKELGVRFEQPVEVRATSSEELADIRFERQLQALSRIEGGVRGDELTTWCRADSNAGSPVGYVDLQGRIHITVEKRSTEWEPSRSIWDQPDVLDIVLIHELVHVHQHRHLETEEWARPARSLSEHAAWVAVIEGHADYIARRVAVRRGLQEAWDELKSTEPKGRVKDPLFLHWARVGNLAWWFSYLEGRRFVGAVVEKLGYEAAVKRLFAQPLPSLAAISRVDEYFAPASVVDTDLPAQRIRARLGAERDRVQIRVLPLGVVRLRLEFAGHEDAARHFREAHYVDGRWQWWDDSQRITVRLIAADGPAGAERLREAWIGVARKEDDLRRAQGAFYRALFARHRDEGRFWIADRAYVDPVAGHVREQQLVVRQGSYVLEVIVVDPPDAGEAKRIARKVLPLIDPAIAESGEAEWEARWRDWHRQAVDSSHEVPARGAALIAALQDPHPAVNVYACALARRLPADVRFEVPLAVLRQLLRHSESAVRREAFRFLDYARDVPDVDGIRMIDEALDDEDVAVRYHAVEALPYDGSVAGHKETCLKALRDEDPLVRRSMLRQLTLFRRWHQAGAIPRLVELLEAPEDRALAAEALGRAGEPGRITEPHLRRLLEDEEEDVRLEAARALARLELDTKPAVALAAARLASERHRDWVDGAELLEAAGRDGATHAPALIEALSVDYGRLRRAAANALAAMGVREAVPHLEALLDDENEWTRKAAKKAIEKLTGRRER